MKKFFPLLFAIAMMPAATGVERSLPLSPEGPELAGQHLRNLVQKIWDDNTGIYQVALVRTIHTREKTFHFARVVASYKGKFLPVNSVICWFFPNYHSRKGRHDGYA